ncbi:UDP-N-acetylglucosamine 2-epimerase (non-hydrolyzing), partial [bacterium]|nr:UDP-N-acetylglucosamine 2-epimerase (non-hydrolyzing) [bacterium]
RKADMVIVGGDVNSTLACSLVASKLRIPIAHVEAGLRSFDRTMPEEINRVVTDLLSELLFTTCDDANANLEREGIPNEKVFFVGNPMIDTLMAYLDRALETDIHKRIGVAEGNYALLTLHRPSNVDKQEVLSRLFDALEWVQSQMKLLFPAHPRTSERIRDFGLSPRLCAMPNVHVLPPLRYMEFLSLMARAKLVLTDSGGIQEETTILGVPCVTLRWNTERPVTIREGTNVLAGNDPSRIITAVRNILDGSKKPSARPKLWDGKAAKRIVEVLKGYRGAGSKGREKGSGS